MFENSLIYAGVDEAGRGPLAGPVMAAAVILNPEEKIHGLKDSKLLTPQKREQLFPLIQSSALAFGIGEASVEEIDKLNIFWASMLAMERAIEKMALKIKPELIIIDGKHCPKTSFPVKAIVKADQFIPAVSAASILAKVTRDAKMCAYDLRYPGYEFAVHKGYPTPQHKLLLKQLGMTDIHRKSFKQN